MQPKPRQAAQASGRSFISAGLLPFLAILFAPVFSMVYLQYGFGAMFLAILGRLAAKAGVSAPVKATISICFWRKITMVFKALVATWSA